MRKGLCFSDFAKIATLCVGVAFPSFASSEEIGHAQRSNLQKIEDLVFLVQSRSTPIDGNNFYTLSEKCSAINVIIDELLSPQSTPESFLPLGEKVLGNCEYFLDENTCNEASGTWVPDFIVLNIIEGNRKNFARKLAKHGFKQGCEIAQCKEFLPEFNYCPSPLLASSEKSL